MITLRSWLEQLKSYFDMPLMTFGSNRITILTIIYLVVFSVILFFLTGRIRKWIVDQLLTKTKMDRGAPARRPAPSSDTSSLSLGSSSFCRRRELI